MADIAVWSPRLETGIETIDKQHKQLFQAINDLNNAFKNNAGNEEVARVLSFLVTYTVRHFEDEEAFMKQHGFPGLDKHKAEHSRLLTRAAALQSDLREKKPVTVGITVFVADWLRHHITGCDMEYVKYVQARGLVAAGKGQIA